MAKEHVNVAIRVRQYRQLFDSRDPSPFLERDLDDDAVDYIVSSVEEKESDKPVHLKLHIAEPFQTEISEEQMKEAFHRFFEYQVENGTRRLRELVRLGQVYLIVGIIFLTGCLLAAQFVRGLLAANEWPILQVIPEGLVIMGWVAMWRPIEYFLYDWWPIVRRRKIFERIAKAKIEFVQG